MYMPSYGSCQFLDLPCTLEYPCSSLLFYILYYFLVCSISFILFYFILLYLFISFSYTFLTHPNIFVNNQNTLSNLTVQEEDQRGRLCPAAIYLVLLFPFWALWVIFSAFCLGPCLYYARSCKVIVSFFKIYS